MTTVMFGHSVWRRRLLFWLLGFPGNHQSSKVLCCGCVCERESPTQNWIETVQANELIIHRRHERVTPHQISHTNWMHVQWRTATWEVLTDTTNEHIQWEAQTNTAWYAQSMNTQHTCAATQAHLCSKHMQQNIATHMSGSTLQTDTTSNSYHTPKQFRRQHSTAHMCSKTKRTCAANMCSKTKQVS
jgi:hypothetical protein